MTESERPESDAPPPSETDFAADNRYGNDPIPVSPRLPKPQPGLLWSVVAAVVFLAITIVALIGGTAIDLIVRIGNRPDPQAAIAEIQAQLQNPGETSLPPLFAKALGTGMLVGELTSVLFSLVFLRLVLGRDWHRKIALRLPKWHHLLVALLMLPALMILHGIAHELARMAIPPDDTIPPDQLFREMFADWPIWLAVLTVGFGPGIGEELCCRGYIGRGLLARYGFVVGILLTSTIFGLMHMSLAYAMGTAIMGGFLHAILVATRSLWITILMHAINNSISVLAAMKVMAIDKLEPPPEAGTPWSLYGASLAVAVAGFVVLYRSRVSVVDRVTGELWKAPWATAAMPSNPRFVARSRFAGFGAFAAFGIAVYTLIHVLS